MKLREIFSANYLKIFSVALLVLAVAGFFYFENSLILRITIVALGLVSVWQINNISEIILVLVFYLAINDLYNIHYWSGLPIAFVIIAVFFTAMFLFYFQATFSKVKETTEKNVFRLYTLVFGLSMVQLFLAMTLWPVDPRTKSLVLTVIFFIVSKIIYLYVKSVISFKKTLGYIVIGILIFLIIAVLNIFQGL